MDETNSGSDTDVTKWKMNPAGMLRYFNSVTYTLRHAVADLVDNCIDAGANNVLIEFNYNRKTGKAPFVIIADDGKGIKAEEWEDAMELGKPEPKDLTKLATYGVGMKLSSLTQAQEVTIYSRPPGEEEILVRRISKDEIEKRNKEGRSEGLVLMTTPSDVREIPQGTFEPEKLINHGNKTVFPAVDGNDHPKFNTVVTLERMHKLQLGFMLDKDAHQEFLEEKDFIRCHLGMIYHRILEKRGDDLVIKLNGARLKPLNPFLPLEESKWHGTIRVEDKASIQAVEEGPHAGKGMCPIKIAMHVIPNNSQLSKEGRSLSKDIHSIQKKTGMQGLYFYRNDRIIQYGGWHKITSSLDTLQLARCSIEIPPKFYEYFGVSPYKLAVEPGAGVKKAIIAIFEKKRHWGKLYGSKKGKKPFTGKKKDYLTVIGKDKARTDKHGVAAQRYSSEGKKGPKGKKVLIRWKDDEDPYKKKPPEEEEPEEEPPIEDGPEDEAEVDEKPYRIVEATSTTDTIELDHAHPNYDAIHDLLKDYLDVE